MKTCNSPRTDGFTAEFFNFFWSDIGVFLMRSLNYEQILCQLHKNSVLLHVYLMQISQDIF